MKTEQQVLEQLGITGNFSDFLLNNLPGFVYVHDTNDQILYLSPNARQLIMDSSGSMPTNWKELLNSNPENLEVIAKSKTIVQSGENPEPYLIEVRYQKDKTMWLEIHETVLKKDGCVTGVLGIGLDVTTRIESHQKKLAGFELFSTILKNYPRGLVLVYDVDTSFLVAEGETLALIGLESERFFGKQPKDVFSGHIAETITHTFQSVLRGDAKEENITLAQRHLISHSFPLRDANGEIIGGAMIAHDITDEVLISRELEASKKNYQLLIDYSVDLVVRIDTNGHFLFVSPSFCELFDTPEKDLLGKNFADFVYQEDVQITMEAITRLYSEPYTTSVEQRWKTKYGLRWLSWTGRSILNEENKVIEMVGIGRDVTSQKEADEVIQKSLHEKEVMLKEINHRVKNNLQLVSSLLHLQADTFTNEKEKAAFLESQNRIHSLSIIHEQLYKSSDITHIEMDSYIRSLYSHIVQSYNRHDVSGEITIKDIFFSVDQAIPCGLLINEILSNALKHAFPLDICQQSVPQIRIELQKNDNTIFLNISDNGLGSTGMAKKSDRKTLGMELIYALVQQLEGKISIDTKNGVCYAIEFPYTN